MNATVKRILETVNVPTNTEDISKVAWEAGMHTGSSLGEKASNIIDEIVDFIMG